MGPKMGAGVWKDVYPQVFGHSKQLSLNRFFDTSTPSMRKGCDGGGKNGKKTGKKKKIRMKIVATRSLPAVDRPNADRWNAARSRQYSFMEEFFAIKQLRRKQGGQGLCRRGGSGVSFLTKVILMFR